MKNESTFRYVLPLLGLMVFFSFGLASCSGQKASRGFAKKPETSPEAKQEKEWEIHLNTKKKKDLPSILHGFNTNLMGQAYPFDGPEFDGVLDILKPATLRFPGGTIANYYRWQTDDFADGPEKIYAWYKASVKTFRRVRKEYGQDGFVALAKKHGVNVVLVASLETQTPTDMVKWLDQLKKAGLSVGFVELGNEIYLTEQNTRETARVTGYIKVCKEFTRAIKKAHPEVKVGVCAARFDFTEAFDQWNRALSKEEFYDGVIYHDYMRTQTSRAQKVTIDDMLKKSLAPEKQVDWIVDRCRKIFGGKPIWLTEWNLYKNTRHEIENTGITAIYGLAYFLRILHHSDAFELATFHTLMFGLGRLTSDRRGVQKNAYYPAWELVGKALDGMDTMPETWAKPESPPGLPYPLLAASAFQAGEEIRVLAVNRTALSRPVGLWLDNQKIQVKGSHSFFSAGDLSPGSKFSFDAYDLQTTRFQDQVTLLPYSVNLIAFKITARRR